MVASVEAYGGVVLTEAGVVAVAQWSSAPITGTHFWVVNLLQSVVKREKYPLRPDHCWRFILKIQDFGCQPFKGLDDCAVMCTRVFSHSPC